MLYVDTTYLFRVYSTEPGHEAVKALLPQTDRLAVAWHGRAEFASILLRKRREGSDSPEQLASLTDQFQSDCRMGFIEFLPLTEGVMTRLETVLALIPVLHGIQCSEFAGESEFNLCLHTDPRETFCLELLFRAC